MVIAATPEAVLEFVLDLDRYRKADRKVGPVWFLARRGNRVDALVSGHILGLPTAPGRVVAELTPYSRLDVKSAFPFPGGFRADFTCEDAPGGDTLVTHRECLDVPGPVARRIGGWLQDSVDDELQRMKELLEAEPGRTRR